MPTVCTDIKLITFICKTNACIDLAHQNKTVHIKNEAKYVIKCDEFKTKLSRRMTYLKTLDQFC